MDAGHTPPAHHASVSRVDPPPPDRVVRHPFTAQLTGSTKAFDDFIRDLLVGERGAGGGDRAVDAGHTPPARDVSVSPVNSPDRTVRHLFTSELTGSTEASKEVIRDCWGVGGWTRVTLHLHATQVYPRVTFPDRTVRYSFTAELTGSN